MIVEPKQYTKVIRFRPREAALQNARTRLENMLTNEDNSPNNVDDGANFRAAKQLEKVVSNIAEDSNTEESRQTTNDLDAVVFLMSETLPNMEDGEIRGSAVKTLKLCEKNEVVASFKNDQYFLKSQSRPNAAPHVITVMQTCIIRCNTTCEKYQKQSFCSHCICVGLKCNEIQRYTVALSHYQEKPLNKIASRKIQKDRVGRKRAIRQKGLSLTSPEKPSNPPKKQGI